MYYLIKSKAERQRQREEKQRQREEKEREEKEREEKEPKKSNNYLALILIVVFLFLILLFILRFVLPHYQGPNNQNDKQNNSRYRYQVPNNKNDKQQFQYKYLPQVQPNVDLQQLNDLQLDLPQVRPNVDLPQLNDLQLDLPQDQAQVQAQDPNSAKHYYFYFDIEIQPSSEQPETLRIIIEKIVEKLLATTNENIILHIYRIKRELNRWQNYTKQPLINIINRIKQKIKEEFHNKVFQNFSVNPHIEICIHYELPNSEIYSLNQSGEECNITNHQQQNANLNSNVSMANFHHYSLEDLEQNLTTSTIEIDFEDDRDVVNQSNVIFIPQNTENNNANAYNQNANIQNANNQDNNVRDPIPSTTEALINPHNFAANFGI